MAIKTRKKMRKYTNRTRKVGNRGKVRTKWDLETKEEKYSRLRKIRNAIASETSLRSWWYGDGYDKKCRDKSDLHIQYPYNDSRTCMRFSINKPIPIDNKQQLERIRRSIGGPLGFEYYFAWAKNSKVYFDG